MTRLIIPHAFALYSCELTEAFNEGRADAVVGQFFPKDTAEHSGMPIALRWSTRPSLGFPRQPFNVYRRSKADPLPPVGLVSGSVLVSGHRVISWGGPRVYEVELNAAPDPGKVLIVQALDWHHETIPGQRIAFTSSRRGRFRAPGITALRVTGHGTISNVQGVDQCAIVNAPDWKPIEVVGFPFQDGELGLPVYNPLPQWIETDPLPGVDAAKIRLEIDKMMQLPPPNTGIAGVPTPDWPAPDASLYLQTLRDLPSAPMELIRACLKATDDADPNHLQVAFMHEAEVPGIRQADGAGSSGEAARVKLPVVGVTLLLTSSDSFAATGLGYGTIDFPPPAEVRVDEVLEPPGTVHTAFDYMVTTEFTDPTFGTREYAALAQPRTTPETLAHLDANAFLRNRAAQRDQAESESVQLTWNLSSFPQGYGIIVSRNSGQAQVLNAPRQIAGGFDPFIPQRPPSVEGEMPFDQKTAFVDAVSPIPLTGSATSRYLVAGLDIFGRWSGWRDVLYSVSAPDILKPSVLSATIELDATAAIGRVVPAEIEIEFSWDWSDRSPERVEFTGTFFSANADPAPSFTGGFALQATGAVGPKVVAAFDETTDAPSITSAHVGTIEPLDATVPNDPNVDIRRYRLTIEGMVCDFTTTSELAYAVYARAVERVRPTTLSAMTAPIVERTHDPIPPAVPSLPVDLRWTALPDAAGRARGVLTWPASPDAKGYVVWEATESALRHLINPALPEPPSGTPLLARAEALRDLIIATPESQAKSQQAFARVNTRLLTENRMELELPGEADTLYAYRVSAVNFMNVESARSSTPALFAVPRRNQPGQPRLLLRTVQTPSRRIRLIALPGPGVAPAGYRVYRVRREILLRDVGLMGPPKIDVDDPRWTPYQLPVGNNGSFTIGVAIDDDAAESWYPYYYRVVAVGRENLVMGEYRGESEASAVQQAFLPPANPPTLDNLTIAHPPDVHSVVETIAVGGRPVQVAVNPHTSVVYVTNSADHSVSVIGTPAGGGPTGGETEMFAMQRLTARTSRSTSRSIVAPTDGTIAVGSRPSGIAVNPITDQLYVANTASNSVSVIDGSSQVVVSDIPVAAGPNGIAVNERLNTVYVTHPGANNVTVINGERNRVEENIPVMGQPIRVAVDPQTDRVYVTNFASNSVSVINGSTNQLEASVQVGSRPMGIAVHPDTNRVYVANAGDGTLSVLDGANDTVESMFQLDNPTEVAVNPVTHNIYVTSASNTLTVLDGSTGQIVTSLAISNGPQGVAVNPTTHKVYVVQTGANTVTVIETSPPTVSNRVFSFATDLPVKPTPLGEARIELIRAALDMNTGRMVRERKWAIAAHEAAAGAPLTIIANPTPEQLAAMPEITRSAPDAAGRSTYTVRVRAEDFQNANAVVVVRDPLNRTAEAQFMEVE